MLHVTLFKALLSDECLRRDSAVCPCVDSYNMFTCDVCAANLRYCSSFVSTNYVHVNNTEFKTSLVKKPY